MMKRATTCLLLLLPLGLSACGGVADTLGLGRNPPDEFAVVDRPPLSLPPDFDLKPPRPGAPRPQEITTSRRASETLYSGGTTGAFLSGEATTTSADKSDAERALLEQAGAAKAAPDIRQTVDRETSQRVVGSKHLLDDLLWWRGHTAGETTVDAAAEAERLRKAKEKGEDLTKGATPVIEKGSLGLLGL